MKIVLLTVSMVASLAACAVQPSTASSEAYVDAEVRRLPSAGENAVYRIRDNETGVVCYVSDGYNSGGIACAPSR